MTPAPVPARAGGVLEPPVSQAPRGQCKGARPTLCSRAGPCSRSRGRTAYAESASSSTKAARTARGWGVGGNQAAGHAWCESAPCRPRGRLPGDGPGPHARGLRREALRGTLCFPPGSHLVRREGPGQDRGT